jgi:hypothetical protein
LPAYQEHEAMTMPAVILEGARRAAFFAALLFTFNAPDAADAAGAAGVRGVASQSALHPLQLTIDGSIAESGLTLAAHHVDVHVVGNTASVRTRLQLRNDSGHTVWAHYVLPQSARLIGGGASGMAALDALCDGDLSSPAAEVAEAAPPPGRLARRGDVIVVPADEEITVEVEREVEVVAVGAVRRLSLPLPVDREAPWVPRFSADVLIEADRPIKRLASPTHEALVDGIGERSALLSIDGFVYRQPQLAVVYELEAASAPAPRIERNAMSAVR